MNTELRHEVTIVVNGESRRVMVDDTPNPEAAQEPEKVKAPATAKTAAPAKKAPAKKKPAAKKAETKKPGLLQRAKDALTGKGKKA